jgi:hypothetical protein
LTFEIIAVNAFSRLLAIETSAPAHESSMSFLISAGFMTLGESSVAGGVP